MAISDTDVAYLRERMRRGDTVLFCGAGFSRGARNRAGTVMPLASELPPVIWKVCYPGEPYDGSRLDDLFQVARAKAPRQLREALLAQLSVDPGSIAGYYAAVLALPWFRIYTLNVDDLISTVARITPLPRHPAPLSAVTWAQQPPEERRGTLQVVHLNGMLDDSPDGITFSPTQYAERLAGQEPLYAQCAVDVLSRPVVYVGTPLDETPLWQHVHMRRRGPRTRREFRRRSFIVTPALDRARRELLEREFNVTHLPMTVEEFAVQLAGVTADVAHEGLRLLASAADRESPVQTLPLVQDLAATDAAGSADFLLGRAPRWGDIRDGFASTRKADEDLADLVIQRLSGSGSGARTILLTGTAGAGKSTVVMRSMLALSAHGTAVGWADPSVEIAPLDLRRYAERDGSPTVLVIDEADRYGAELVPLAADIARNCPGKVLILTMRSGRGIDRVLDRAEAAHLALEEFSLPNLTDTDIGSLIDVLDEHNRLGMLKAKPRSLQVAAIRDHASRQLLVAMLEATSGRRFEELISSEWQELSPEQRDLYGIVAVASSLRFGLGRDELLLAAGDSTNATLSSIDALQRRQLVIPDRNGVLHARHRVIADVLLRTLAAEGILADVIIGLARAAASKVTTGMRPGNKNYRRMRALMSHNFIIRELSIADGRRLYEELEAFLNWDHHYWLQRGTFELESDNLGLAENFLNQAFAIEPEDGLVQTEVGYLRLKLAIIEPAAAQSRRLLDDGFDLLDKAIASRREGDPHQYHIYGQMATQWVLRGDVTSAERRRVLDQALAKVEQGRGQHPRNELLRETYVAIQNARLGLSGY